MKKKKGLLKVPGFLGIANNRIAREGIENQWRLKTKWWVGGGSEISEEMKSERVKALL